jgi:predicted TIM-barrel fold metal-dependent hydrolase
MRHLLISADTHVKEPVDLWTSGLPDHLRGLGPRIDVSDGETCMMVEGTVVRRFRTRPQQSRGESLVRAVESEISSDMVSKGDCNPDIRLRDLDTDGVWGEVMFPNLAFLCAHHIRTPSLQIEVARLYNDWLADLYIGTSDRFCPVALLPILDIDASVQELHRLSRKGFHAVMLPVHVDQRPYNDLAYEPLWSAAEELAMPLTFHAGTGRTMTPAHGPGGAVINYVVTVGCGPMEGVAYLCGSGVLERHPGLRVVMVESGSGWLAWVLHAMDDAYREHAHFVQPKLKELPSEYFRRQGFVTFQHDPVGFHNTRFTGDDCLMWGSDYPHSEGTWPNSLDYLTRQLDGVPEETIDKVLYGNAARLYRFRTPADAGI